MNNLTAGNPIAHRVRLYYEGTSTIYEGMPVCYNYDTTDNWFGGSVSNGEVTATTTTAEGSQNEGKYIRCENAATANLQWFAGVVSKGGWVGKTGARVLDVYVPNGAVVPARINVSATVGRTVLFIANADQDLTGTGRPVGVAAETADGSSAEVLCLVKLDPRQFNYQKNGSTNLLSTSLTGVTLNDERCDFAHTSGYANHVLFYDTYSGTLAATGGGSVITAYLGITGSITATTSYTRTVLSQLVVSGTINGSNAHLTAGHFQLGGSPTFTACSKISALWADIGLGVTPSTGDVVGLRISNNGSNQTEVTYGIELYGGYGINKLFNFDTCAGITGNFISNGGTGGSSKTITSGGDWKKLKVEIDGTDYFMLAMVNPSEV